MTNKCLIYFLYSSFPSLSSKYHTNDMCHSCENPSIHKTKGWQQNWCKYFVGVFLDRLEKPGFPSYRLNLATIGNYLYLADRTIQRAPRMMKGIKRMYFKGRLKELTCVEQKNKFNCLERH